MTLFDVKNCLANRGKLSKVEPKLQCDAIRRLVAQDTAADPSCRDCKIIRAQTIDGLEKPKTKGDYIITGRIVERRTLNRCGNEVP